MSSYQITMYSVLGIYHRVKHISFLQAHSFFEENMYK